MTLTALVFYLFAVSAIVGGLFTVISRNPVHSVLWLILAFLSLSLIHIPEPTRPLYNSYAVFCL